MARSLHLYRAALLADYYRNGYNPPSLTLSRALGTDCIACIIRPLKYGHPTIPSGRSFIHEIKHFNTQ
jgi:hypothetical protein